jgi:hypothetical protein
MAAIALYAVMILCYPAAFLIDERTLSRLAWESGVIQVAGALLFLVASLAFLVLYLTSAASKNGFFGRQTKRNIFWLLLAVLMFVCCGEEASWGQHLIGFETPEIVAGLNAQDETNIHNLWIFHQWRPDGSEKGFWGLLINANRLLSVFWLGFFVVIPIAATHSPATRRILESAGMPIPPLWIGGLFLASFASYKVFAAVAADTTRAFPLDELKETTYAAVFTVFALYSLASTQPFLGYLKPGRSPSTGLPDSTADQDL